jgi:hypothetical protein
MTRAGKEIFDCLRTLLAHEPGDLSHDFAACGFLAEDQTRNSDDDDKEWSQRKRRVIGQGRAHARGVVLVQALMDCLSRDQYSRSVAMQLT